MTIESIQDMMKEHWEIMDKQKAEIKKLREALEFYADKNNWINYREGRCNISRAELDFGETARKAL